VVVERAVEQACCEKGEGEDRASGAVGQGNRSRPVQSAIRHLGRPEELMRNALRPHRDLQVLAGKNEMGSLITSGLALMISWKQLGLP
jgi:hypothetical protein